MSGRQTSPELFALATRILNERYNPTDEEIKSLAGSVLSQDETKGPGTTEGRGIQTSEVMSALASKVLNSYRQIKDYRPKDSEILSLAKCVERQYETMNQN